MTISFNHTDNMTPIATPYQDANGTNTRLESQIELDEELHLSPVKFYYSHNDPGQYSIGKDRIPSPRPAGRSVTFASVRTYRLEALLKSTKNEIF